MRGGLPLAFAIVKKEMPPGNPAVGLLREDAIIGFLMNKLGETNVQKASSGTDRGYDLIVYGQRLSIKTVTGKGDIKVLWTADTSRVQDEISRIYSPEYDILLVRIHWGKNEKSLFYIPNDVQLEIMERLGRENYLKVASGTNHRGIAINSDATNQLLEHENTIALEIDWEQPDLDYDPIERWRRFWAEQDQRLNRERSI